MITAQDLIGLETLYGGYHTGVPWNVVSPHGEKPKHNWLTGGDRMSRHGYAQHYADILNNRHPRVVVELGILRGTGLAIWCNLFPEAQVIGLDIDLKHFMDNYDTLDRAGAFQLNEPEVWEFDELSPDAPRRLQGLLGDAKVDLFIDDALHDDESILRTLDYVRPHMSAGGTYVIEDNDTAWRRIALPKQNFGLLTVIQT